MATSSDLLTLVVERARVDEPWGLRLQGGVDCQQPFSVCKVRTRNCHSRGQLSLASLQGR